MHGVHTRWLLSIFIFCLLCVAGAALMTVSGCASGPPSVAEMNKNPNRLSGRQFAKGSFEGLNINNAHIKGARFTDIQALRSIMTNITFEDCDFTKVNFSYSTFTNVAFVNCTFKNSGNPDLPDNRTDFSYSIMKDVLFDRCSFYYPDTTGIEAKGFVLFRDIKKLAFKEKYDNFYFHGKGHVSVSNCNLPDGGGFDGGDTTTLMVRSSLMKGSGLTGKIVYIEDCQLLEKAGAVGLEKLVITRSILTGNAGGDGRTYLINNSYRFFDDTSYPPMRLGVGVSGGEVYIIGDDSEPAYLRIGAIKKSMVVDGLLLDAPLITQSFKEDPPLAELNFHNVTIKGGKWKNLTLLKGQWENVKIYPKVVATNAQVQNITAHNLQFPDGTPWVDAQGAKFDIKESSTPFEWKEIKAPTPEELGLVWWPEVEPGYRPSK